MLFETKTSKFGILDLLKQPESDPVLRRLFKELGLDLVFYGKSSSPMSLLDCVL